MALGVNTLLRLAKENPEILTGVLSNGELFLLAS